MKKGDIVFGINEAAQMPRAGGRIARVVERGYFYIEHLGGGGIGFRDEKELKLQ